tara:strand:+ start:2970 stop:4997 length:2028 start_codon:yes stop_codon:yes gene_type:complete
MQKRTLLSLFIVGVIAVVVLVVWKQPVAEAPTEVSVISGYIESQTFSTDTTLNESRIVNVEEVYVLESDAILTVNEAMVIEGAVGCRDGSLSIIANAPLTINGTIACEDEEVGDVTIVATEGLTMSPDSEIIANGNVQIVDSSDLIKEQSVLDGLYDATAEVSTEGLIVGPLVDEEVEAPAGEAALRFVPRESILAPFIKTAHAQVDNGTTTVNLTNQPIRVSGKIKVGTPRKGAKRVVVFDFPNTPEVTVQDFELEGPKGRNGDPDTGSCDVEGKDGEDAFRFNAFAPNLIVNNFTLILGDGGDGGEATTGDGCDDARAKGGKGGKPGNFKMVGSQKFEITGAFIVHPGNGGGGGGATAKGKVGEPGEKGGDARATGGKGADNKKKLTVAGTVAGTSNVQFGDAVGGYGGSALAEGGAGGDAEKCGQFGGPGGKANARSGDGGDAKLTITGGARRMDVANDIGGQGGLVEAYGGVGGVGGSCDETQKGGDGGKGGDAAATEGKGGFGKSGRAADGAALGDDGGDGGKGGDGCTEGIGGDGGSGGTEDGEKGEDGQNICITITKEEDYISLLPGEIQVIKYKDYYIPIANLGVFSDSNKQECDGGMEHWHPGPQGAIETGGMTVPDPDPNECGFGKVSDTEIHIIMDPNYIEEDSEEMREGGEMIQIDPPKLILP